MYAAPNGMATWQPCLFHPNCHQYFKHVAVWQVALRSVRLKCCVHRSCGKKRSVADGPMEPFPILVAMLFETVNVRIMGA